MKSFNLKEYLENPLRKVVTREGYKVNIIYTGMWTTRRPIVALINTQYSAEQRMTYTVDGKFISNNKPSRFDLFFKEESSNPLIIGQLLK